MQRALLILSLLAACSTKHIGLEGYATRTTAELHLYADGTSGNDANDGLTAGTPKKTLGAVFGLIPSSMAHDVLVHLKGIYTLTNSVFVSDIGAATSIGTTGTSHLRKLIVNGEYDTWTDVGGGTKTATGSSVSSLVVAGAGWTVDAYAGYIVKVLTGPAAGQARMIQGNTADTITPVKNFGVDPGVGATFDIVRPSTEIKDGSAGYSLNFQRCAPWVQVNSLYFSGKTGLIFAAPDGGARIANVVINSTASSPLALYRGGSSDRGVQISTTAIKDDGSYDTVVDTGVSVLAGTSVKVYVLGGSGFNAYGLVSKILVVMDGGAVWSGFSYGSRLLSGLQVENVMMYTTYGYKWLLDSTTGYATTKVSNPTGVGVIISSCLRTDLGNVDISNCGSHGVEVIDSRVTLSVSGATSGTGNAGAGVYAHSGSVVHIKDGTPPTLTGTVGDFSTDGTTAATTWAAVDGGTPYTDASELTMVKEVP